MVNKGLTKGLPITLRDLEDPCPICLLTKATEIPIVLTIDVSKSAPGFILQINFPSFNVEIIYGFNTSFVDICYAENGLLLKS